MHKHLNRCANSVAARSARQSLQHKLRQEYNNLRRVVNEFALEFDAGIRRDSVEQALLLKKEIESHILALKAKLSILRRKAMLCKIACAAASYAAGWMTRQPAVKEESLTDWLLDYFSQQSPNVRYYLFNRNEESEISGADWDWWLLLRKGCFKIRVQAKKIKKGKDHYRALAHVNRSGYQIDLLLNSSARFNFYPIYAIYGFSESVERCHRNDPNALFICSAQEIYDLIFQSVRRRIRSSDILGLTVPMSCLFCCPLTGDIHFRDPQKLFDHYFRIPPRAFPFTDEKDLSRHEGNIERGYENEVPPIIKSLFEIKERNSNTEGIIKEYQSLFKGSNGVVIVKYE